MILTRRTFLKNTAALIAAPGIVQAANIMSVSTRSEFEHTAWAHLSPAMPGQVLVASCRSENGLIWVYPSGQHESGHLVPHRDRIQRIMQ